MTLSIAEKRNDKRFAFLILFADLSVMNRKFFATMITAMRGCEVGCCLSGK
jgi:hypothetical protein